LNSLLRTLKILFGLVFAVWYILYLAATSGQEIENP